ncbi:5216_t:CDS:2, partial [Funneliformis geosporum]
RLQNDDNENEAGLSNGKRSQHEDSSYGNTRAYLENMNKKLESYCHLMKNHFKRLQRKENDAYL